VGFLGAFGTLRIDQKGEIQLIFEAMRNSWTII
jgi:hypothetical protein